jgi:hypothetical protein
VGHRGGKISWRVWYVGFGHCMQNLRIIDFRLIGSLVVVVLVLHHLSRSNNEFPIINNDGP